MNFKTDSGYMVQEGDRIVLVGKIKRPPGVQIGDFLILNGKRFTQPVVSIDDEDLEMTFANEPRNWLVRIWRDLRRFVLRHPYRMWIVTGVYDEDGECVRAYEDKKDAWLWIDLNPSKHPHEYHTKEFFFYPRGYRDILRKDS